MKRLVYLLIFVALSQAVFGANLHGTVYDSSLDKVDNAIVEVNTIPKQRTLSIDGEYSFDLGKGAYELKAYQKEGNYIIASTVENITIESEGDFIFDLFLFPDIGDEDLLDDLGDITIPDVVIGEEDEGNFFTEVFFKLIIVVFIAVIIFILYKFNPFKKKGEKAEKEKTEIEPASSDDLSLIIEVLKKEGGRATQKDIRKEIPYSEAKISLMISELEHKGKVERIKKGRGNIVVLK